MKHSIDAVRLKSGAEGLFIHVPGSHVVDLEFTFLSGYAYADPQKYEIAHIMEHLIFGANKYFSTARRFSREFGLNGAYHNAYTSLELNGYIAESASFEAERILDLFWQGLTSPSFLPKEFGTEIQTVKEELAAKLMAYPLVLALAVERLAGNSYILDFETRISQLNSITPDDMRAHHEKTHTARNMRFIVAGDVNRELKKRLLAKLESHTRQLEPGRRFARPQVTSHILKDPVLLHRDVDKIFFGLRVSQDTELSERELLAGQFLSYILTGAWDSRIFGKGRERGLLYGIDSSVQSFCGITNFVVSGSVTDERATRLFRLIRDELKRLLHNGVSEAEIKRARRYFLGSFRLQYQTVQQLVGWYSRYFSYDDYDDFLTRPALIESITKKDVTQLVDKLFSNPRWAFGVLSKEPHSTSHKYFRTMERIWK